MVKRAAIYARISRAYEKEDDRLTIELQLKDCEDYCQKHGYLVVARFVDKDKYKVKGKTVTPSGTRKDRPAYVKMLKGARAGEFDVIVAWKEDRLYRGMYGMLPIAEALEERRGALSVELVTETFDMKLQGIKAAIAKIELDNIRDRMVWGRAARLERGEVPGSNFRYGYTKEAKHLVVIDSEAAVIRMIFDWYNDGVNIMEMRRRLTAMGVQSRNGPKWSKTQLQHILAFEGYASGQYEVTLMGQSFTISCPQILPAHVWQKSLETRAGNTNYRGRNVKEDYLCAGLVTCPCGSTWQAKTTKKDNDRRYKTVHRYGYYRCNKRTFAPEGVHPDCPKQILSDKLDREVWDFVREVCSHPEAVREAIDKKIGILQAEQESTEEEAERLQRELDEIQNQRSWVITMARTHQITEEDMALQLGGLHIQALELRKRYNEVTASTAAQQQAEALKRWAETYLSEVSAGVEVLSKTAAELNETERERLYDELDAARFEAKYEGDQLKALDWAMLEERRRVVRTLISSVLVVGKGKEKRVIPQLVLEVPRDFVYLASVHQSAEYRIPTDEDDPLRLRLDVKLGSKQG